MNISQIFAIAKKDMKLNFRFKYNYFGKALINPVRSLLLFGVVYYGFFAAGSNEIAGVTKENYVIFLLLGSLVFGIFSTGFYLFYSKLLEEKYWRTIQALLIAPVNKLKLIIGMGMSELIRQAAIMAIFLAIAYVIMPIPLINLLIAAAIILLLFFGVLGLSLIYGAIVLSNENFLFAFDYLFWGIGFLSCFYYPIEALPEIIRPLVLMNPIYHGLFIVRGMWINGFSGNLLPHFMVVLAFAIVAPISAVYFFNYIIKKLGLSGY